MKLRRITYKYTPAYIVVRLPIFLITVTLLFQWAYVNELNSKLLQWISNGMFAIGLLLLVIVVYRLWVGILVWRRQKRFDTYVKKTKAKLVIAPLEFADSSLSSYRGAFESDVRDRRYFNSIQGKNWAYSDYSYAVYGKTKRRDLVVAVNYYSVMAMKLPRRVPNILFDSLHSRGRQYRTIFAGDQVHNFEGDFNKYFSTYIPYGYTIRRLQLYHPGGSMGDTRSKRLRYRNY